MIFFKARALLSVIFVMCVVVIVVVLLRVGSSDINRVIKNIMDDNRLVDERFGYKYFVDLPSMFFSGKNENGDITITNYKEDFNVAGVPSCKVYSRVINKTIEQIKIETEENCKNKDGCIGVDISKKNIFNKEWIRISYIGDFISSGVVRYFFALSPTDSVMFYFYDECVNTNFSDQILASFSME